MTKIAASILSADFANLNHDCTRLLEAGVDLMHFDVMDGHFVPNISYGAPVLKCLHAAMPDVYYDVHLMISDPARYAADFARAGASLITFHLEAVPDTAEEVIAAIRAAIRELFGDAADQVRILYGGSMNDKNATELMSQPEIDGGLIGGASLVAEKFEKVINYHG